MNRLGIHTVFDTVILYGLLLGLVALGVVVAIADRQSLRLDDVLLVGFLALSFLFSGLIDPANKAYMFTSLLDYSKNPMYVAFLYSVPGFYFARRLENYDHFRQVMATFSYSVVILSVFVYFAASSSTATQYMTFSYNMLTQLLFLCLYPGEKWKLSRLVTVAAGFYVFLVGGARGAMISMFLALALWAYLRNGSLKRRLVIFLALIAAGIAFAFLKNHIFLFLSEFLDRFSISSRNFRMILQGEFLNDSNRMKAYRTTISHIGVLGAGLMGDRVLLKGYPHNLFLEWLYQYGWILGSVLVLCVCALMAHGIRKRNRPEWIYIMLLLPCGFLKLMVTGSYLNQEPVLLGFCVNSFMRRRSHADSNDQYRIRSRQYR